MKALICHISHGTLANSGWCNSGDGTKEEPTSQARENGVLSRVANILDIPQEKLANAFKQASQERNLYLNSLIVLRVTS